MTEEDAPVTSPIRAYASHNTEPDHAADFKGWVQERAMYMPRTFDAHYHPLDLQLNDPGEPANRAAIIDDALRQGTLRLHDAGVFQTASRRVPGGVEIFVNLLSMSSARAAADMASRQ